MSKLPTGLVIVAILLVLWLGGSAEAKEAKAPAGDAARVTKTLEICADVMGATCDFGEPIDQLAGGK